MKKLLFILIILSCTSCSQKNRNKFGLDKATPDEYQSTLNKPLEIPPSYR